MRVLAALGGLVLFACQREPTPSAPRLAGTAEIYAARLAAEPRGKVPEEGEGFFVSLERSQCYGFCPSYKVDLFADGTVKYTGKAYVRVHGAATGHVPPARVAELAEHLQAAGLLDLKWEHPCTKPMMTDNPSANVVYLQGGRRRTLEDYHGDACVPATLRALEDEIDRVAGTTAWTTCKSTPEGYCPAR